MQLIIAHNEQHVNRILNINSSFNLFFNFNIILYLKYTYIHIKKYSSLKQVMAEYCEAFKDFDWSVRNRRENELLPLHLNFLN